MAALDAAIKAMDRAAFTKAYADLTDACHQSAGHPMIVIQVPTVSSFPDQDFRPEQGQDRPREGNARSRVYR
jgi:hypothetical protein